MKDMVADMNYNLVVLVLPCRDMEELYCNKMGVLALPCSDGKRSSTATRWWCWSSPAGTWKEELNYNKMVVLFYSSMDKEE